MPIFDDNKEAVVVFEKLVYFGDSRMVNLLKLTNLLLKQLSLVTPYLVFVNNIGCANQSCLFMDDLP